jgi:Heavy metal associated domain 2
VNDTVAAPDSEVRSLIGRATLAHAIPGRIRLRLDSVRGDADRARQVEQQLSTFEFVDQVTANPRTGAVIIEYATELASEVDVLRDVASALDVEIDKARHLPEQPLWQPVSSDDVAAIIRGAVGDANSRVARATRGMDLRIIVPGALLCLGIGSFLGARRRPMPDWYSLLWYGYNIFERLNPPSRRAGSEFTPD